MLSVEDAYAEEYRLNAGISVIEDCSLDENELYDAIFKEMLNYSPRYALIENRSGLVCAAETIYSILKEMFGRKFVVEH